MALSEVQNRGLTLWHAIQCKPSELPECFADTFKGSLVGFMNGQENKVSVDKQQMIAMCMLTGQAANVLKTLQLQFGLALWGKQKKPVFLINYNQQLVFTPTAPPSIKEDESGSAAEDKAKKPQDRMFSRGLQAFEWETVDGKAVFTTMHGIEVDEVEPLDWQSVANAAENARAEDPQSQSLKAKTFQKLHHIVASQDFPDLNAASLPSLGSRQVEDLRQLISSIAPLVATPSVQLANEQSEKQPSKSWLSFLGLHA